LGLSLIPSEEFLVHLHNGPIPGDAWEIDDRENVLVDELKRISEPPPLMSVRWL